MNNKKSVVLLSHHPFDGLFKEIMSLIGPLFFEIGLPLFEAVCLNIASWYMLPLFIRYGLFTDLILGILPFREKNMSYPCWGEFFTLRSHPLPFLWIGNLSPNLN